MFLASLVATIRAALIPILLVTTGVLTLLLVYILAGHAVQGLKARRRRSLIDRYQSAVDALLDADRAADATRSLMRAPARHRDAIAGMLLALLRIASGAAVDRVHFAARSLDLVTGWTRALADRHWWRRANAARALGCVGEVGAVPALVARLGDDHEEVRAAAVEALGLLGDARAVGPLVAGLSDGPRLQQTRVVLALRACGRAVVEPLLAHERRHVSATVTVADLLGLVGEGSAIAALTAWCSDSRPDVRAAALRALGTLGPCDRTYFHALRALGDEAPDVRAMAARAVGRSRRGDAAPYLAGTLSDEWTVAVEGARALRDLGGAGRLELERAASDLSSALARQMLWEIDCRAAHGGA